jgi:uncharacterized protein (TIGR02453 family)
MSTPSGAIDRATLRFLSDLKKNNDRDWFTAHKDRYEAAMANMRAFADALIERMRRHDKIATADGKEAMYRIYNDLRFHKDKPPYKEHLAGSLVRVKPALRGGYYFHIKPGDSFIACGFWAPEPDDLKKIRTDILYDHPVWRKLLGAKRLREHWGELEGEQLKTAPQGFPKDHPAVDLLRFKQFIFSHAFTDKEVLAPDLADRVDAHYRAIRPWLDHLSEVLTTDENGNPI